MCLKKWKSKLWVINLGDVWHKVVTQQNSSYETWSKKRILITPVKQISTLINGYEQISTFMVWFGLCIKYVYEINYKR